MTTKSPTKSAISVRGLSAMRAAARPDEWAVGMGLRVDGRHFTLEGREYIRDVIRDLSPVIVVPKAAQTAFTVTALVKSLHFVVERKLNGLYLLPTKTHAIPFVQSRVDPIIESNEFLRNSFSRVDNRLHKQTKFANNLYIRGTNIERELQEVPVDFQVWDERDRMVEDNLEEARHRMDGSRFKRLFMLSTPTVPGHGIDAEDTWWASDQHRWEIACPHCSRYQVLSWDENFKLGDKPEECVIECGLCHKEISDEDRWAANATGRWVATNLQGTIRGYHISQMNSPVQTAPEIAKGWFTGQKNIRKLRTFFNANLGLPFVAPGDQFTPELLDKACVRGYSLGGIPDGPVYVGIDIGTHIHVKAYTRSRGGIQKLWQMKIFREWGELDNFLSGLTSWVGVVDAHPEKRAARDLAIKYHGKLWVGFEMHRPQTQELAAFQPLKYGEAGKVIIDRTMAFDTVINDFMNGNVHWPWNARHLGEEISRRDWNGLYHHMIQMVRIEEEDAQGRIVARWVKNKNPDHWHHAGMFARMAMEGSAGLEIPADLSFALNKGFVNA